MLWHTVDFKQPETCVLCRFCWDDIEENHSFAALSECAASRYGPTLGTG